ncbi:CD9 antigen [Cynoglossus semilaevis]|uniref:Tetraspanin n=1 Tax=Cynoglossus semilaevis TaxID=244447 RepID=A0A3P8VAH2_CYNSE|nr:CD9 antigen-like [Cynoglossus semilaevis]
MAVEGCGVACKYILIVFNIIFAVLGFAFLGLGLWLRFGVGTGNTFESGSQDLSIYFVGATVLMTLGAVLLMVVVFGDYGACNEKQCPLIVFCALLVALAAAMVVFGALAYTRRQEVGDGLVEFYTGMYNQYANDGDPAIGVTLTAVHNMLNCCGVSGMPPVDMDKQTCSDKCSQKIIGAFNSYSPLTMGIFLGTGALLITALVCAVILLIQIKRVNQEVSEYYSAVY